MNECLIRSTRLVWLRSLKRLGLRHICEISLVRPHRRSINVSRVQRRYHVSYDLSVGRGLSLFELLHPSEVLLTSERQLRLLVLLLLLTRGNDLRLVKVRLVNFTVTHSVSTRSLLTELLLLL